MMLEIITVREIDERDLDIWLKMYREECGCRFDQEQIKKDKTATWTDYSVSTRSKATTTITIVDRKQ